MSELKLKELIKKRGSFKAKLTQFTNFFKLLPTDELDSFQVAELECRLGVMKSLYKDFDDLQTQLELLSENADDMYQEREAFETQYFTQMSRARSLLPPDVSRASSPAPNPGASSTHHDTLHASGCKHDFVRLPKIDLPHFNGDYQHWLEFRDTYISIIHDNNSIQSINKFHYLRAALTGSASLLIKSIDFKADNYTIAWQLLLDRYHNERLLVNNHVQALFNFPAIQKESCHSLRNMIDNINKNLRALDTLGQPTAHWDTLIIYIMSKKLDNVTNREWEEHKNNLNHFPNLKHYTKYLSNRADLLETLHDNKTLNNNYINTNLRK
ncbi:uncharacterized protein LOC126968409 [Leptidea sinapis]|uniref:uncharacterized protein LOC126968409 n=1 Tax=Leptidea sinapis TaxID=189913 RepID=UPI0021C332F3|nr:uncharacterized protein LOC126968409 [Leptidea sinapis]XP_050669385.1 uncharacterized protein LOC126968409 [Leptidea sinapis]XP_050669386.1 uncharacterized protein LOC126968409 [Leptidea sinapis]